MKPEPNGTAYHRLRTLLTPAADGGPDDAELLERFVRDRDEAAFELLVWRHRGMVLGVCRRALRDPHDADDAFQATFLTLARKAGTVGRGQAVAGWLHTVAVRVAWAARSAAVRRAGRERAGADLSAVACHRPDGTGPAGRDALAALDREIDRLPPKYRLPVVLCYLQGLTYRQAGQRLAVPPGTLSARLAWARDRLRGRLLRRGIDLAPAAFAALLAEQAAAAISPVAAGAIARAAASAAVGGPAALASTTAYQLSERTVRAMFLLKLRRAAAALVGLAAVGGVLAVAAVRPADPPAAKDRVAVSLRGTWTMPMTDETMVNGVPQPPKTRDVRVSITDSRIRRLDDDGFVAEEMGYALNPAAGPNAVDLSSPQFGGYLGIYRLDGDKLRLCFGTDPGKRPTEFPAPPAGLKLPSVVDWDLTRVAPDPVPAPQRHPNPPGCFWMSPPQRPPSAKSTNGMVMLFEKRPDGSAVVTLAAAAKFGDKLPEYRPVLFDGGNQRHLPTMLSGGSAGGRRDGTTVALHRWRMDPKVLPAAQVALLGVEQVTTEAHVAAAREAFETAKKRGLGVLPYPEVGKPYDFAVMAADGKTVSARDLRGKVVVIDWWATWCSPCMKLLPEVKELAVARKADGLAVVGVNLDRDRDAAAKAAERVGIDWPQVNVPDVDAQTVWMTAAGTNSIPLVLVIGRDGVLRAVNPPDLKAEVEKLLGEKK